MASLSRTGRVVARTALALWLLFPGLLWAQGTSPWVEAVNELQAQFTGPIARGLSLIAIVVGGLMFAFGEGGSKRTLAGIIFGLGMAMGCGELPGLAVLMRGLRRWAGYPALNRPLTILGVERRGFLLSATLALAMWNAMNSLVTGGVVFAVGYGAGWLAGRRDPDMLGVLRAGTRYPARFDPGKWAVEPWHLLIRSGR